MNQIAEIEEDEAPKMHPHEIQFWSTQYSMDGSSLQKYSIVPLKFLDLIAALDFCSLDIQDTTLFVKVEKGSILEEVRVKHIREAAWEICKQVDDPVDGRKLTKDMLLGKFVTGIKTLFDEMRLQLIRPVKPFTFVTDTPSSRWTFFRNCAIKVLPGMKYERHEYEDLDGCIWKKQILPRDFREDVDYTKSVYYNFMGKVCAEDPARLRDLMKITGYLLHGDISGKAKMINFTDGAVAQGKEANGRSGKSLFMLGLAYATTSEDPTQSKVVTSINGKDFNPGDDHKYQLCGPETRLLILNDLKDKFPVKQLYNDITEGITVNRKYKAPFKVKVKVVAVGNEALWVEGESSTDRILEFTFANYFSSKRSPQQVYGHWFFRDWDPEEWAKFDALMLHCVQLWLADPVLPETNTATLGKRKMREHTSPEFDDFMQSYNIATSDHYDRELDRPTCYNKKDMYMEFRSIYSDYDNPRFRLRNFTDWIRTWTRYNDKYLPFEAARDEFRNNKDFFIMFRKNPNYKGN